MNAGQTIVETLSNAFDKMFANGALTQGDRAGVAAVLAHWNDPAILNQLNGCGGNHAENEHSFFDWIITPAHAEVEGCTFVYNGLTYYISKDAAETCVEAIQKVAQAYGIEIAGGDDWDDGKTADERIMDANTAGSAKVDEAETWLENQYYNSQVSLGLGKLNGSYDMVNNPAPLASLPNKPAANFSGGKYVSVTLDEDVTLYRAGDANGKALGQWFTQDAPSSTAQVRIDTAVKPQWIDPETGVLTGTSPVNAVYAVKIPAGTEVYIGPVGSQGGIYVGGSDINQIFVPQPWKIPGVEVIGPPSALP